MSTTTSPEPAKRKLADASSEDEVASICHAQLNADDGQSPKRPKISQREAVLALLNELEEECRKELKEKAKDTAEEPEATLSLDDIIEKATEKDVEKHAEEIWELFYANEEIPFLSGLLPPCKGQDHVCNGRIGLTGEPECTMNAKYDWGVMKIEDEAWTCLACYQEQDPETKCSKQSCPNFQEHGQCERCRPSYAFH
jgi:hypothetical protein